MSGGVHAAANTTGAQLPGGSDGAGTTGRCGGAGSLRCDDPTGSRRDGLAGGGGGARPGDARAKGHGRGGGPRSGGP